MSKKKETHVRRHEVTDPNPISMPVKFQRPPTLAEQIARFMGAHERFQAQQGEETIEEAEDFDIEEDDSPHSPHELVYDEQLNREMPRYEKMLLDRQRAQFEEKLQQRIREDRVKAEAVNAQKAQKSDEKSQKKGKKIESAEADEE